MDTIKGLIDKYIQAPLRCSVYYRRLGASGTEAVAYDIHPVPSASLIKVPIMAEAFRQQQSGALDFSRQVAVYDAVEGGSFFSLPQGTLVTVGALVRHMIVESDNTCTNMLLDMLGMDAVNQTIRTLGMEQTILQRKMMDFRAAAAGKENMTTAADMGHVFTLLYENKVAAAPEMLALLQEQEDNCILPAQLPHTIPVAHKTGELDGIYHDCGIIYDKKNPFVLCILAEGIENEAQGIYDLSYLSRAIFDVITE